MNSYTIVGIWNSWNNVKLRLILYQSNLICTFFSSHLQTVAADVAATRTAKHRRNTFNSWWQENIKCIGNCSLTEKQTNCTLLIIVFVLDSVCPRYFWNQIKLSQIQLTIFFLQQRFYPFFAENGLIEPTNEHFIVSKGLQNVSSF